MVDYPGIIMIGKRASIKNSVCAWLFRIRAEALTASCPSGIVEWLRRRSTAKCEDPHPAPKSKKPQRARHWG